MLTTLDSAPRAISMSHARIVIKTRWLRPRPRARRDGERVQLAPGVWIVRDRRWLPVSALDSATEIPQTEPDEEELAQRPPSRWQPAAWKLAGLCSLLGTERSDPLFFGVEGRKAPGALIDAVETARRICDVCPVKATCLTNALVNDERYGVWGGTSGGQRDRMRDRLALGASVEELVAECLTTA